MKRARYALVVALATLGTVGTPSTSAAADPSSADVKRMRERFEQAKAAQLAERYEEALSILREVASFRTTPGVLFHIANCEEHLNQLAEALRDFERAESMSVEQGVADVRELAIPRIVALKDRVPRLTLSIPAGTNGVEVTIDGTLLPAGVLSREQRLNPGQHTIAARAPGRQPFDKTIDLKERDATSVAIDLPASTGAALAPAPAVAPPDATSPGPRRSGPPLGTWIAGAGALALGIGGVVVFAVAGNKNANAEEACANPQTCDTGVADSVQTLDRVALALWIGAGLGAGTAVTLWVLDRPKTQAPASARVRSGAELVVLPGGAAVRGAF